MNAKPGQFIFSEGPFLAPFFFFLLNSQQVTLKTNWWVLNLESLVLEANSLPAVPLSQGFFQLISRKVIGFETHFPFSFEKVKQDFIHRCQKLILKSLMTDLRSNHDFLIVVTYCFCNNQIANVITYNNSLSKVGLF